MIEITAKLYRSALIRWVNGVHRHAVLAVLACLALTVAAGTYSATHFAISTATTDMLSPELDFRRYARALSQAFPQFSDNLLVVIDGETPDLADDAADKLGEGLRAEPEIFGSVYDPAGDAFFRRNGLLYLNTDELLALSDQLAEAQPFLGVLWRDPSLKGLFDMLGLAIDKSLEGDGSSPIDISGAMEAIADTAEAQVAGRFGLLSWRNLMTGEKDDGSDRRRFILLQPPLDFGSLSPAADAMTAIREQVASLNLDPAHGVTVRLTGSAALDHEELKSVEQGIGLAGLISLVLVIALLVTGLKSFRLVVATLAALVAGLTWTAGFAFVAIGTLNLISVAFAVLFIGLSVDFGIHFGLRYKEAIGRGISHDGALSEATEGVGGAITLCAVTAAIGFYSFLPTDYLGLAELGLIAGTGMFIALAANLTVLPAVLTLMPLCPVGGGTISTIPVSAGGRFFERRARLICITAGIAGLAALALAPQARFDFDPLNLKDPRTESVSTLFDLMSDSRTGPYDIAILAPDLATADRVASELNSLDTVKDAVTLLDYVATDQDDKLAIVDSMALFLAPALAGTGGEKSSTNPADRKQARATILPKLDRLVAEADQPAAGRLAAVLRRLGDDEANLEELERRLMALLPGRIRDLKLSLEAQPMTLDDLPDDLRDRQIASDGRARVEVRPRDDVRDRDALRRFVSSVRGIAPDAAGTPVVILEAGNAVVTAFAEAAVTALATISLLLMVLFRRLRDVGLVFAPLALAAAMTVAASVLFDLPFNFANVIVLPLLFGLGVANGIHLVERERDEAGVGAVMMTSTPRAVVFSALTTIGSFASLAISNHPGTASMGILLTIAIACAMVASLGVLPALMVWTKRRRGE